MKVKELSILHTIRELYLQDSGVWFFGLFAHLEEKGDVMQSNHEYVSIITGWWDKR